MAEPIEKKALTDPEDIIKSQESRLGEVYSMFYPVEQFPEAAKKLISAGFKVVAKTPATSTTVYKTRECRLVLDRWNRTMNKSNLERISFFSTDGGKIVGSGIDLTTLNLS